MSNINFPAVINNNLTDISVLMERLGKIQYCMDIANDQLLSVCTISSNNNVSTVTRLLDPHLDEVCDRAVSIAVCNSLREEAKRVIDELARMGITLDDSITAPLLDTEL